jgi:hypothetical protein
LGSADDFVLTGNQHGSTRPAAGQRGKIVPAVTEQQAHGKIWKVQAGHIGKPGERRDQDQSTHAVRFQCGEIARHPAADRFAEQVERALILREQLLGGRVRCFSESRASRAARAGSVARIFQQPHVPRLAEVELAESRSVSSAVDRTACIALKDQQLLRTPMASLPADQIAGCIPPRIEAGFTRVGDKLRFARAAGMVEEFAL